MMHMTSERKGNRRGIYSLLQVKLAYLPNKIEGSQLSKDQTEHLFNDNRFFTENGESVSMDDINETINHF